MCVIYFTETKKRKPSFGSSLLLSNAPLSPKIVNASFAAIFDDDEFTNVDSDLFLKMHITPKDSPGRF